MDIIRQILSRLGNPFSKLRNKALAAASKKADFRFESLPRTLEELKALPEAVMDDPFKTAALSLLALCAYSEDKDRGIEMLNFLRGPRPMSPAELSFLNDRVMDGKNYVARSYFAGARPENDYTPTVPYSVKVISNQYSKVGEGYMQLWIHSGGADSPRSITLRKTGGGTWYLWEQNLLTDIRIPRSQDAWA